MIISMLLAFLPVVWANDTELWSKETLVRYGGKPIVRFQTRIEDGILLVKATHEKGWHTYAMDNELLAAAALKGKKSLGIEQGITIKVEGGLVLDDAWLQTKPADFSNPELRWFTYGFDRSAIFACRIKTLTGDEIQLRVQGQACSGDTCCQIDLLLTPPVILPNSDSQPELHQARQKSLLNELVPVRSGENQVNHDAPKS